MYSPGYVLRTQADFDNAIFFQLPIDVYRGDECIDQIRILKHTFIAVRFSPDAREGYIKVSHEFRVGSK